MIIHKKTIDSTNTYALELLTTKKLSFGTMIIADSQTKGKGRHKRTWISPEGNLYCSIVLHCNDCFKDISNVSFASSLAVLETLKEFGVEEKKIDLKWPNDVLINNRKISGILIETNGKRDGIMVVGIGVNLKYAPKNTTSKHKAISLKEVIDNEINPKTFAIHLRIKLLDLLKRDDINKLWLSHAININKEINVNIKNKDIKGIFKGIDKSGHLLLEKDDGKKLKISSGDIFF